MQGLKINECGDQIVPIPIQRNNCIESVRLRKEILVNSAKMQESVQPLQNITKTKSLGELYLLAHCNALLAFFHKLSSSSSSIVGAKRWK